MKKIISLILTMVIFSSTVFASEFEFRIVSDNVPNGFETIGIPGHGSLKNIESDGETVLALSKESDGNVIIMKNNLSVSGDVCFEADILIKEETEFTMSLLAQVNSGGYKLVEAAGAYIAGDKLFVTTRSQKQECIELEKNKWYSLSLQINTEYDEITLCVNNEEVGKLEVNRKIEKIATAQLELMKKNSIVYLNNVTVFGDEYTEEINISEDEVLINEQFDQESGKAPQGFSMSEVPQSAEFIISDELGDKALKIIGNSDAPTSAKATSKFTASSGVMVFESDFILSEGASQGKILLNIQGTSKETGKEVNAISVKLENNAFSYYTSLKNEAMGVSAEKGKTYRVKVIADTKNNMAHYYINNERKVSALMKNSVSEFTNVRIETQAMPIVFVDNLVVKKAVQPKLSKVEIKGTAVVGAELVGNYEFFGEEAECEYRWLENVNGSYVPIEKATEKTYKPTLSQAQNNQKIKFEVTIFDKMGIPSVTKTSKATEIVSLGEASLTPPVALNVCLNGKAKLGERITASYDIESQVGEGTSVYEWYIADSADGEYTLIENRSSNYLNAEQPYIDIEQPHIGKYLRFAVTPYDKNKVFGEKVFSEPTKKIGEYVQYDDIEDASWAKASIENLTIRGSVKGASKNSFEPNRQITRAEFVKLLMTAFALEQRNAKAQFSDVEGKWYHEYVATAQQMGFLDGIYDGTFDGDKIITREETATIAYRITKVRNVELSNNNEVKFSDESSFSDYACEAVKALASAGVIDGKPGGIFDPKGGLTRAEAVKIIDKISYQTLDGYKNVHPRLYVTAEDVEAMRGRAKTDSEYKKRVEKLRSIVDIKGDPPAYKNDSGEQLWLRDVGNSLGNIAGMYLATGDKAYAQKAEKYAVAICNYPTWGNSKKFFRDLPIGHLYQALAISYDWCYDEFSAETKKLIEETCFERLRSFYDYLILDEADTIRGAVLQNHLWVETTGMAMMSIALYDKAPEVYRRYINAVIERYMATRDALGNDGASHEGVGYWQYGAMYMLKFMSAARQLLGVDLYDTDWWRNTAYYQIYMTLPYNTWGYNARFVTDPSTYHTIVDIGDSPRYSWYGPDTTLLALAKEFNNGYARTVADMYSETGYVNSASEWINVVFYDQSVTPKSLSELPTMKHFDDLDIVSMRSGWSGSDSLVIFKCGAGIGEYATRKYFYDPADGEPTITSGNSGHVHPDAGIFNIYYEGDWLIKNGGYNYRQSKNENVLLVDTLGQLEQPYDMKWFDSTAQPKYKLIPDVTKTVSNSEYDFVTGDATPNYPMLNRWKRHLIYLKKLNAVIVIDDIASDEEHELDLMFHTDADTENVIQKENGATVNMQRSVMEIKRLTPENLKIKQGDYEVYSRSGALAYTKYTMELFNTTSEWKNAMAFTWTDKGAVPAEVTLTKNGNEWVFDCNGETITFDWTTETVK